MPYGLSKWSGIHFTMWFKNLTSKPVVLIPVLVPNYQQKVQRLVGLSLYIWTKLGWKNLWKCHHHRHCPKRKISAAVPPPKEVLIIVFSTNICIFIQAWEVFPSEICHHGEEIVWIVVTPIRHIFKLLSVWSKKLMTNFEDAAHFDCRESHICTTYICRIHQDNYKIISAVIFFPSTIFGNFVFIYFTMFLYNVSFSIYHHPPTLIWTENIDGNFIKIIYISEKNSCSY